MVDLVLGIIGTVFYPLFCIIFLLIDAIQAIFYAFAGIGNISFGSGGNMWGSDSIGSGNSGAENDTGIVYYLLNNDLVKNMLMSIMLLAFFLVIIFTVLAFIKNAYSAKPKGWKAIVANAIKGLGNFILLPVCVLLGVWLGNILLQAINGATSAGGSTTMARKLFISSSYNANIYRNVNGGINDAWSGFDPDATNEDNAYNKIKYYADYWGLADELQLQEGQSLEYYANKVDEMYSYNRVYLGSHIEVAHFYNLYQINYLILVVGGIFMLYALASISAAMVKRIFYILILFIISPGVCALYPLDEGKAVGSWSGEVKKQVLSAYGAVAGMNLFYSLLPLIENIFIGGNEIWAGINTVLISDIIQLFIMVIGLLTVKDLISLISGFVGGDDAYSKGTGVLSNARNKMVSGIKKGVRVAGVASPFVKGAARSVWNVTKGLGRDIKNIPNNYRVRKREKAINSATITDEERSNFSYEGKQALYNDLFSVDNKKQDRIDKKADKKLDRYNKSIEQQANKAKRKQENKQFVSDMMSDVGTFFEPLTVKVKEAGKAVKNSEVGQAFGKEAKKLPGGAKKLFETLYEETGMKKLVDEFKGEYTGAEDRQAKRDKIETEGRLGEQKVLRALEALTKGGGHIDSMSTSIIKALGDSFGDAIAKRFFGGKLGEEIVTARNKLGLDKTSKTSDLSQVDNVLQRLQHFADRISNSEGDAREQYIQGAIEYARDTDAGGNAQLQEALNEAFAKFSDTELKVKDVNGNYKKQKVELDEDSLVGGMVKASKDVGRAMAKEMMNKYKEIMKDIDKENRKKK